ncbi:MAG: ribonuclease P protein component [Sphingobacteriales bacterium]|jgi:ribonuclease P protein component|nr:ribonuclease P protein component [Sphingobacteriales bacterium]
MKKYYFRKEERLCSIKQIEQLYSLGSSFSFYPFRIIHSSVSTLTVPAQIVISVPKRKFKRAVDRNRIKRQIREAYRFAKTDLLYPALIEKTLHLHLLIIYTGNEIITTESIRKKLNLALERLLNKI